MKALPFITLALCIGFLAFQQVSLSSKTRTVTSLKTRLADAKSSRPGSRDGGREGGREGGANSKSSRRGTGGAESGQPGSVGEIDLQELADAMMSAERGRIPNLKAMMRVQSLILEATPEELTDLIARTAELDVPDQVKQRLIGEFVGGLADHDPKAALELAFGTGSINLDRQRWRLSGAFSRWAKDDPNAAIAWFDAELAKGSFESKSLDRESNGRIQFETSAIGSLLSSNPERARQRLLALPESERRDVLDDANRLRIDDGTALAHAQLVRETVPAEQQATVLGEAAQDFLRRKDYEDLVEYTGRINANDSEREAIVREAVDRKFERFAWERKTPTAEDVAEMHTFLQAQVPDSANELAGSTLASYGRHNNNFESAAGLVRELHQTAPSDETLVGFLRSFGDEQGHRETARELAGLIADPAVRENVLDRYK